MSVPVHALDTKIVLTNGQLFKFLKAIFDTKEPSGPMPLTDKNKVLHFINLYLQSVQKSGIFADTHRALVSLNYLISLLSKISSTEEAGTFTQMELSGAFVMFGNISRKLEATDDPLVNVILSNTEFKDATAEGKIST